MLIKQLLETNASIKKLDEGVSDLSVVGSDGASDCWYSVKKEMLKAALPLLKKEMLDKGNEFNTSGAINVAMILVEKFQDMDVSEVPGYASLIDKLLNQLTKPNAPWSKIAGYKKLVSKLEDLE